MPKHDYRRQVFNGFYMSLDVKPKGKWKRAVAGHAHTMEKREIKDALDESLHSNYLDLQDFLNDDIQRAFDCHDFGPCEICQMKESEGS